MDEYYGQMTISGSSTDPVYVGTTSATSNPYWGMWNEGTTSVTYPAPTYYDTGYFYSPYVPLQSGSWQSLEDLPASTRGILKRYGAKILTDGAKQYVEKPARRKKLRPQYRSLYDC